jgi:acetolactate decarboxylase
MNKVAKAFFLVGLSILWGCNASLSQQPKVDRQQITQVSILNALMLGHYDGVMPVQELLRYGDFGLGTCDHLDGELIVLDGKAYQAKADGTVVELAMQTKTPFAVVTLFDKAGEVQCADLGSLEELEAHLDGVLTERNLFFAIRVESDFESLTIRSVPRQEPPYEPLVEVAKKQTVETREEVKGTLIGIRSPKWVGGLSVPGYHWHFLSADRKLGGHVLNCKLRKGTAMYDPCESWLIKLDESSPGNGKDLSVDLSEEVERVERVRSK